MLELVKVTSGYGSVAAVEDIDITVPAGACVCLIGANGAGKTTTLLTICGLVRAFSGTVRIEGRDMTARPADKIVRAGVSLVPEGRRGGGLHVGGGQSQGRRLCARRATPPSPTTWISSTPAFPASRSGASSMPAPSPAASSRCWPWAGRVMARPKLLLLDEPSMGLAPHVVNDIFATIADINAKGTTVLLVEQNARKALSVASYGYVMEHGRILFSDTAEALARDPRVIAAYLGMRAAESAAG